MHIINWEITHRISLYSTQELVCPPAPPSNSPHSPYILHENDDLPDFDSSSIESGFKRLSYSCRLGFLSMTPTAARSPKNKLSMFEIWKKSLLLFRQTFVNFSPGPRCNAPPIHPLHHPYVLSNWNQWGLITSMLTTVINP